MTVTLFSVITSILLCNVYIIVIAFMRQRNSFLIRFSLAPLALLIAACIAGSIHNLLKYVHQSIRLYKSVNVVPSTHDMRAISCMDDILAEIRKNTKVKIIQSEEISIPMIIGFFKPIICLPSLPFSDDELKNILLHEWSHCIKTYGSTCPCT